MKRIGKTIKLKTEKIVYYRELHANPWPEVIEHLKLCKIGNYSIFIDGDTLFSYFEYYGDDIEKDVEYANNKISIEKWIKECNSCQIMSDEKENVFLKDIEEVFYMK